MNGKCSESSPEYNSYITRKSRSLPSLPRELTSIIFENLYFTDKLHLRESCTRLKIHIDDHFRRNFIIQWLKKLVKGDNEEESTSTTFPHEKILLLSIEQYMRQNFNPPYIHTLIEMTKNIARYSTDLWWDIKVPIAIEEREKLLKFFYQQANEKFTQVERKVLFILSMLNMLKCLCDLKFSIIHPFNRKSMLRLSFVIQNLFFAIPFYKFIFDWFHFDTDWIEMLLLFVKFLEIKQALDVNENVEWVKFVKPMTFEDATVIFGSENPFKRRTKTPSKIKCQVLVVGSPRFIAALRDFIATGIFDWEAVGEDDLRVDFEFSCPRAKVLKCRSVFTLKIHYNNHQSNDTISTSLQSRDELQ